MRLYVKKVPDIVEASEKWGVPAYAILKGAGGILCGNQMYFRCNKKGVINWDTTVQYSVEELIERNDVKIIA